MIIVLDSNILVAALGKRSLYRPIFDALLSQEFELAVSNEMLEEYQEVVAKRASPEVGKNVIQLLLNLPNIQFVHTYYRWQLIVVDPDDDKFVDCFVAAQANYLISDDKHFQVLKETTFPKVELMTGDEFLNFLRKSKRIKPTPKNQ